MATSTLPLLFLLLISAIATTSARPCKTLFFITSTSFYPIGENSDPNPNPNPKPNPNPNPNPRYLTFFFTSTSNVHPHRHFNPLFNNHIRLESPLLLEPQMEDDKEARFLSSSSSSSKPVAVPSSMRGRTKDIMGLVVAMLLGMGCGVLTAMTMYLIWSLFMPSRFEYDDDDNDIFETNKLGEYVAIPAKTIDNDDDLKKPANGNVPVAKEAV